MAKIWRRIANCQKGLENGFRIVVINYTMTKEESSLLFVSSNAEE